jgi:uncharacterized phiE125 gp8 family phage protein
MAAILLEPPASEPLSLAEAKSFLRVEHGADDALIAALVVAARQAVEQATLRVLITQTWRLAFDRWPRTARLIAPVVPLRSLVGARVLAYDGTPSDIDLSAFTLDTFSVRGAIIVDRARVAEPGRAVAGIELDVTAGYGVTAAAVPEPLRHAIRLLTARFYEKRDQIDRDELPAAVAVLVAPYRVMSL